MKPLFSLNFIIFSLCALVVTGAHAAEHKVLVVMSYEQDNPWCGEIREGIDSVLSASSQLTYFYMDTKINLKGGEQKAREAWALYQQLQPDGVITVDDNAQKMFVLPYLKDKVETHIMCAGVNAEADKYGCPNSHISGILERGHIRESIAFSMQLNPAIRNVVFFARNSPSGQALLRQYEKESGSYLTDKTKFRLVDRVADFAAIEEIIKNQYDAIYIDSLEGIEDESGAPMSNRDAIQRLTSMYQIPVIGANQYHVAQGALSAVVKTGQEQGETAAQMLLQAMRGTPVSEIPVARNYKGKRVINVTAMKALGIEPKPAVLLGATLIKSE
jgi:ABC-type uncharacterized transport system substrate-binding protein